MSIYDMTLEEDHSALYNMLLHPPTVADPALDSLPPGEYITRTTNAD